MSVRYEELIILAHRISRHGEPGALGTNQVQCQSLRLTATKRDEQERPGCWVNGGPCKVALATYELRLCY